jgi:hypothetical protein
MNRFTKLVCAIALVCFMISTTNCLTLKIKKLPPGQEKKIEDDQSAKDHAPGQEKKDK